MASNPLAARSRADALGRAKEQLSEAAMAEVEATVQAWWPEGVELTDEIMEAICDVVEVYAGDAYGYAAQYWEETVGEASEVAPTDVYSREWTRKEIASSAEAASGADHSIIARRLADHAARMVSRAAGDYVIKSARKGSRGRGGQIRFARVPGWSETCPWCLMLASRGWVYWSRETAGEFDHYHANCRCVVVASDEDHPALEGYDPDALYERYLACRETVDGEIRQLHGNEEVTKAIIREMARRDSEWLRTGKPSPYRKEKSAHPLEKEREVINLLLGNGIEVVARKPRNKYRQKTADMTIRGRIWEMKVPEAFNEKTVKNQFKKAVGQADRVVISGRRNGATIDDMAKQVLDLFQNGDFPSIREVLLVQEDGKMLRMKR